MLRLLAVAAALVALALPAAAVAASHAGVVNRGVVQSVDPSHIVLRTSTAASSRSTSPSGTRVRINGGPGSARRHRARDSWPRSWSTRKGRAVVDPRLRPRPNVTDRGVVTAVTKAIRHDRTGGGNRTFALDRSTRFQRQRWRGAARRRARRSDRRRSTHAIDGPAQVVNVLKRAGA